MNNPNQNNYIQYLTKNDVVKTRNVVFVDNGTTTTFEVSGIIEEYFILAVFQNNLRVMGVGFENIENNDMLGFLNSELSDISLIPSYAFLPPEQVVLMSYNNDYLKNLSANKTPNILIQKSNERLFFEDYCNSIGSNYEIVPLVIQLGVNGQALFLPCTNDNTLYFAKTMSLTGYGVENQQLNGYYDATKKTPTHNGFCVFTSMFQLTDLQADDITIYGYKATFENALYMVSR